MKKLLRLVEVVGLFVQLPFRLYKGQKKEAYKQIKESMISANLL